MAKYKYWVFVSYAHQDAAIARRLKRKLEKFQIGVRLRSMAKSPPEPETKGHVFLDQDDMVKDGQHLPDVIKKEIAQSQKIIVICSPSSASSESHVKLEIEEFINAGKWEDIHPIIVGGDPRDIAGSNDCFPAPLRQKYDEQGVPTGHNNPLSPDFRDNPSLKGPKEWANLLSGLIGIDRKFLYNFTRKKRIQKTFAQIILLAAMITGGMVGYMKYSEGVERQERIQKRVMLLEYAARMPQGQIVDAAKLVLASWSVEPKELPWNTWVGLDVLSEYLIEFSLEMEVHEARRGKNPSLIADVTADGSHMLVAQRYTEQIGIWNTSTKKELALYEIAGAEISSAAFSADGEHILIGTSQGLAASFPINFESYKNVFQGHIGVVSDIRSSEDGSLIMTESFAMKVSATEELSPDFDGTARIWNAETGEELLLIGDRSNPIQSAQFSDNGNLVLVLPLEGDPQIWDVTSGKELQRFLGYGARVASADFSHNNTAVIVAYKDGAVRLWNPDTGEELQQFSGHKERVNSVALSSNGSLVLTGSLDNTTRVWDAYTGEELFRVDGAYAQFSYDDAQILTRSVFDDSEIARVWDAQTGEEQRHFTHNNNVSFAKFADDALTVLTIEATSTVHLWRNNTDLGSQRFTGDDDTGRIISFFDDASSIVTTSDDGIVRILDAKSKTEVQHFEGNRYRVYDASISRDGSRLLTVSLAQSDSVMFDPLLPGEFILWNTETGDIITQLMGHSGSPSVAQISPDGELVLTASLANFEAGIWDAHSGEFVSLLEGHVSPITDAVFSKDGSMILTASTDGSVRLWNAKNALELHVFDHNGHNFRNEFLSIAFSNDLARVVTVLDTGEAFVWDTSDGSLAHVLDVGFTGSGAKAVFSPDDKTILIATRNEVATLWSANTGEVVQRFSSQISDGATAIFLNGGAHVLTASYDGSLHIWDATMGAEIKRLRGHTSPISDVRVTSNNTRLITRSLDESIRHWDIDLKAENILEVACSSLPFINGHRDLDLSELREHLPEFSDVIQEIPDCGVYADVRLSSTGN